VRHGGNHDWYKNVETGVGQSIPRHKEVNETLAKSIIKKLS
jgi:nitrate reductase beta subunit